MESIPDVWYEVAMRIADGGTVKAFMFTCKLFSIMMSRAQPDYEARYCDHLATLKKLFPDAPWSVNPYPPADYHYYVGGGCDPETLHDPKTYLDHHRVGYTPSLAVNPKFKEYVLANYAPALGAYISRNPALTYRDVTEHPEIDWSVTHLLTNKFSKTEFIAHDW